jgi:hypothetical protein
MRVIVLRASRQIGNLLFQNPAKEGLEVMGTSQRLNELFINLISLKTIGKTKFYAVSVIILYQHDQL